MSWSFQSAFGLFEDVRNDWDALNQSQGNHILLDSVFVAPLIRHFGNREILLGKSNDARNPAMALLVRKGMGRWETFQPSQAPLGLVLLGSRDEIGDKLLDLMGSLPGYPLQLGLLQQDPDIFPVSQISSRSNMEILDYVQTGRLSLVGTFEEFWETRSDDLKENLARRRRRLKQQGYTVELVTHRAPEDVSSCLREYGRLESQGWKAKQGTAISNDNIQGRFYREIFEALCARGEGIIFQLLLNGIVVGSELYLARNGTLIGLKTTYDESYKSHSPGFLMKEEIIRQVYREKEIRVIEFYGRVLDWHAKWSNHIRTMFHVNCFRNRWVAEIKKSVKRFR